MSLDEVGVKCPLLSEWARWRRSSHKPALPQSSSQAGHSLLLMLHSCYLYGSHSDQIVLRARFCFWNGMTLPHLLLRSLFGKFGPQHKGQGF